MAALAALLLAVCSGISACQNQTHKTQNRHQGCQENIIHHQSDKKPIAAVAEKIYNAFDYHNKTTHDVYRDEDGHNIMSE